MSGNGGYEQVRGALGGREGEGLGPGPEALPAQTAYAPDDPMAVAEVGQGGVAIDSLADMEDLFRGIPLDQVSTSMTINAPAAVLVAMYVAAGEKQGVAASA